MRNINLDAIISTAILAVLLIILLRGCDGCQQAPPDQMTPEEIKSILKSNFDTLQANQVQVINSSIKELQALKDNDREQLTANEVLLLERITTLNKALKKQGDELKNYIELNTKTEIIKTETVFIRDTAGNVLPVPDYIKRLPLTIHSHYQDDLSLIDVSYDVQKDSITSHVLTYNKFKLSQSVTSDGKHIATVSNDNPHTYTLPGTSVFNLDLPEAEKVPRLSIGLQAGYYLVKDGAHGPGVGVGLNYNISTPIGKSIKSIFKRKK